MNIRLNSLQKAQYSAYLVWAIVGGVLLAVGAFWVFGRISGAIVPFVIAAIIWFLMHRMVDWLEVRGVRRGWGALIALAAFIAIFVIGGALIAPTITAQIQAFVEALPDYIDSATDWVTRIGDQYNALQLSSDLEELLFNMRDEATRTLSTWARQSTTAIIEGASTAISTLFQIAMGLVLSAWLLKDSKRLAEEARALAGSRWSSDLTVLSDHVSRVLGGYLRGTLISSTVTGVLAFIGYALIGLPYAGVLGLITGVLNVIPIIGPWVGGSVAALVGLFISPLAAILSIAVTIGVQQGVDAFISPRIMSKQVALHPIMVIGALLIGGSIGGIAGTVVAVPIVAIAKALFVYYFERSTNRRISHEDGVLFASSEHCDDDAEVECDPIVVDELAEAPDSKESHR